MNVAGEPVLRPTGTGSMRDGPAAHRSDGWATRTAPFDPVHRFGGRVRGLECVIAELMELPSQLDPSRAHGAPATGALPVVAVRRLEARVAAAVLGPAAFEPGRCGDLFRTDQAEAGVDELVRPGEAQGVIAYRPVLRSLDAAVSLAAEAGEDVAWALEVAAGACKRTGAPAGPIAERLAVSLCRVLVTKRLAKEVSEQATSDPALSRPEAIVLRCLAGRRAELSPNELILEVGSRLEARRVKAVLWRLRHLRLAARSTAGRWRATAQGWRVAERPDQVAKHKRSSARPSSRSASDGA